MRRIDLSLTWLMMFGGMFLCTGPLKAQEDDPCSVVVAGQVFCDDFSDGNITDGSPVSWTHIFNTRTPFADNGNMVLNGSDAAYATLVGNDTDVIFADVSIRAQVRLEEGTFIGVASRSNDAVDRSYSGLLTRETASIGFGGGRRGIH